jgi:DNA-binding CsgD family transcriptional regulator
MPAQEWFFCASAGDRMFASPSKWRRLIGVCEIRSCGVANPMGPGYDADVVRVLPRSEPEQFERAWQKGTEMGVEEPVAHALKRRGRGRGSSAGVLSDMEGQVVELVGQGLTNAEVAERLFTSPETVKTPLARAFAKLGVRNRRQLRAGPHPDG